MSKEHRFMIIAGTIAIEFIIGILMATVLPQFPIEIAYTIAGVATGYGTMKAVENVKKSNLNYSD